MDGISHNYPADGLFVIGPICSPKCNSYSWFDERSLNPHDLKPADNVKLENDIDAIRSAYVSPEDFDIDIPISALLFVKTLKEKTGEPVMYYDVMYWGGGVETELAWVFSKTEQVLLQNPDTHDDKSVLFSTPEHSKIIEAKILQLGLSELGFEQPSPFFYPHTRSFPWESYKVT